MKATVISDASFGNGKAGWAAWVKVDYHPLSIRGYGTVRADCDNSALAEVYAALNGVWIAANRGASDILIRSDCMTVVDLASGRVGKEYLRDVWHGALSAPWAQCVKHVRATHVKGHADPQGSRAAWVNDWCDRHAKKALRAARKKQHFVNIQEK